jgi:hypothetical protein
MTGRVVMVSVPDPARALRTSLELLDFIVCLPTKEKTKSINAKDAK